VNISKKMLFSIACLLILLVDVDIAIFSMWGLSSAQEEEEVTYVNLGGGYDPPPAGHWNPFAPGFIVGWPYLEPLAFWFSANQTFKMRLAESYEYDEDENALIVHLREDAKWSDGTSLTSADVLTTFYIGYLFHWTVWDYLDHIEAINDHTVKFVAKKPWIFFDMYILYQWIYPHSVWGQFADQIPELIEAGDKEALDKLLVEVRDYRPKEPVGTGAYKLKSISQDWLIWEKRDDYWRGTDTVGFDEIRMRNTRGLPEEVTTALLLSEEIDYTHISGYERQVLLMEKPFSRIVTLCDQCGLGWWINQAHYPLNIKEVRQALLFSLNRTEASIASGRCVKALHGWGDLPPYENIGIIHGDLERWGVTSPEFTNKITHYTYDPERAEELLKSVGFYKQNGVWYTPNGTRFSFEIWSPAGWTDTILMAENAAQQWQSFGIDVTSRAIEQSVYWDARLHGRYPGLALAFWYCWLVYHPYRYYYDLFVTNTHYYPSLGMPEVVNVPGVGDYNITEAAIKLGSTLDSEEQKEIVQNLAWVHNEYVPQLMVFEKYMNLFFNKDHIKGLPERDDDPFFLSMPAYWDQMYAYMFSTLLHPPEKEAPPTQVAAPPYELYVAIAIIAVIAVVGWAFALKKRS